MSTSQFRCSGWLLLFLACGLLSLPAKGRASIIFTEIEDVPLFLGNPMKFASIDFNADGVLDAEFRSSESDFRVTNTPTSRIAGKLPVPPDQGNFATAFRSGTPIGLSLDQPFSWNTAASVLIGCVLFHDEPPRVVCLGFWGANLDYIGVQFEIAGNTHYGWVEVEVPFFAAGGTIRSFAYESQPGVPIVAGAVPEPGTALLLAIGSLLPLARRHRRRCSAHHQPPSGWKSKCPVSISRTTVSAARKRKR
jgi:hypothetical protein